jgi:hypothetical protein
MIIIIIIIIIIIRLGHDSRGGVPVCEHKA